MAYQKILLALAGKEDEGGVIQEAMKLKDQLGASLSVIHVNDEGAGKPSMMMNAPKLSKEENVREWIGKAGFAAESKDIPTIIVEGGDYAGEIASQTKSFDLLIIGHQHRSRFLAAISDSTDVEVTNQVTCSVLIIPMR